MLIYDAITISEVLNMKDFADAALLSGKGGLKNEVNWIHPLEIWDDPNEWIDGGELIFCCALGVNDPEFLVPFFKQLLQKEIAGFCLQLHKYMDTVPQEMIKLADEYNCPLIVFKHSVRFIDISRNLINTIIKHVNHDYLREKQKLDNNSWMLDWLSGDLTKNKICDLLKMNMADLRKFRFFAVIIEYSKSKIKYQLSEGAYLSIAKNLHELFNNNQFLFYPFFANGSLTGIIMDFGKDNSWKPRFKHVVREINEYIKTQEGKSDLILVAGWRSKNIEDISKSYSTAIETMNVCQKFHIDKYIYEDLNLYYILTLVDDADNLERLRHFAAEQVSPLLINNLSQNNKLVATLKKYYQCNGNKLLTAKELGITRQTLYYRLEQIEELLKIDPLNAEKRLTMELSFTFLDYFESAKKNVL